MRVSSLVSETDNIENRRSSKLEACCSSTLQNLFANNSMMACPDCKKTIKCFDSEDSLNNFLIFCRQKNRKVLVSTWNDKKIVIFSSFYI